MEKFLSMSKEKYYSYLSTLSNIDLEKEFSSLNNFYDYFCSFYWDITLKVKKIINDLTIDNFKQSCIDILNLLNPIVHAFETNDFKYDNSNQQINYKTTKSLLIDCIKDYYDKLDIGPFTNVDEDTGLFSKLRRFVLRVRNTAYNFLIDVFNYKHPNINKEYYLNFPKTFYKQNKDEDISSEFSKKSFVNTINIYFKMLL